MAQTKRPRIEIDDIHLEDQAEYRDYIRFLNSSFDNPSSENKEEIDIVNGDEFLYDRSGFKVAEFIIIFMELALKLHLTVDGITSLLKFIHIFLPDPNLVPQTYNQLVKALNITFLNTIRRKYVCIVCNNPLKHKAEQCTNRTCVDYVNKKENLNKTTPYYITHNYQDRFRLIIAKYWNDILSYRVQLKEETDISDICNAQEYKESNQSETNSVSLILFIDQANFSKSTQENNLYYVLGQIMDLPLKLRNSKCNILHFLTWGGYIYDFNNVMSFITPSFTSFIQSDIKIPELNMSVKVNLFAIICDAPATAKTFNIHQFNGAFGCFSCLHPGESSGFSSRIYPYMTEDGDVRNDAPRTNKVYLRQVRKAIELGSVFEGVFEISTMSGT